MMIDDDNKIVYLASLKYNNSASTISSGNIFPCLVEFYSTHNVHYKLIGINVVIK